ncbi:MAG: hypothetical protein A3K16_03180 [Omnitrophica bacterium RIFCSPLOWO2_01_FULL_45_24]|nr:MAG: hypothetical protein A3C51_05000 [Omnitrophica bacterium RIFCSPHIGHO2_02_FULL_46_20]OGW94819.1 MAG: hypothetical protein A3K16_03180 [Omnitrophica bacterium RIFCSPLOWO2_01_FULL_45_24]
MGMIIAVNGKGGTGKSTVAGLIVDYIASKKLGSILAVDADPNSTLSDVLGIKIEQTMVGVVDETSKKKDSLPAGMTKDRFIEMKIQESIGEGSDFDLLAMGRPEGPGCYCYINSVLRNILNDVIHGYDFLVIDNAAGMEHISRRTERIIDKMVLVSDYSVIGVRSCVRIYALAKDMGIKIGRFFLIINKLAGSLDPLKGEIDSSGITLAGTIDYDEELLCLSLTNKPVSDIKNDRVRNSIENIMKNIMER